MNNNVFFFLVQNLTISLNQLVNKKTSFDMLYFYLIIDQDIFLLQFNTPFMKKIPDGAEVANVWVGELEGLKKSVTAFIRLVEPRFIGDLSQVALPTRFIFLHLTPKSEPSYAFEIGRAISNMMVDEVRYAGQPAKLPP